MVDSNPTKLQGTAESYREGKGERGSPAAGHRERGSVGTAKEMTVPPKKWSGSAASFHDIRRCCGLDLVGKDS